MACKIPVRYLVVLALCFVGLTTNINRDNMYTTIVAMVPEVGAPANSSLTTASTNLCPHLAPLRVNQSDSPVVQVKVITSETASPEKFNWSPELQGIVIGCFFWMSCFCQVPSGYIADKYGGTISIAVSLFATGLISIASPIATEASVWLLITFRVLLGVFQAGITPGMYVMVCHWIPLHERSTALAITNAGSLISGILLPFSTGYLINNYTWKSMFYVPGALSLIILVLCAPFLRNKPEHHPCVTAEELSVIKKKDPAEEPAISDGSGSDDSSTGKQSDPVPWIGILTNVPVLATILLKFAEGISSYMMLSEAPTYFANVFYMNVSEISQINMINYIVYVIGMIASAKVSEELITKGCLSRTNSRKLFSLFSGSVGAISVALIPFSRCHRTLVVTLVYISALMESFCMASDIPLFAEMTNKFPGVLYAIFQVASLSPGFIAPMYSGFILGYVQDQWLAWDIIFYTTSSFLIFANIVFLFFGSARIQPFDHPVKVDKEVVNIVKHPSFLDFA